MQKGIHNLAKYLPIFYVSVASSEFSDQLAQPHGLPELLDILQEQVPGLFSLCTKALACRPQDE